MAEPMLIDGAYGTMLVQIVNIGKYGKNWKEIEPTSARTFTHYGSPIMPPTEWKCLVNVARVYRPPLHPSLYIV